MSETSASTHAQLETDTIVAIATAPGRGGIGVVRLSGSASLLIARRLLHLPTELTARHAHYGTVHDAEGNRLDDALCTWFPAPASYTGEEVVEISTHGSPMVLSAVVDQALHHGARLARPGEFTERAYLAHKLDLTAAEAVRDLIEAQTLQGARLAAQQMGGSLAREVAPAKAQLVTLIAALEAGVDFAEDDLDTLPDAEILERLDLLLPPLQRLEQSFVRGRLLRDGIRLAIVGKPNAGKSSLFNRLLGRERAIVTPIAGTTRDTVGEATVLNGIPVHLLDTAGLRATDDPVERIGVERTYETMADADLVVHVLDATETLPDTSLGTNLGSARDQPAEPTAADVPLSAMTHGCPRLTVVNKVDLLEVQQLRHLSSLPWTQSDRAVDPVALENAQTAVGGEPVLFASALTGVGIDDLRDAIVRSVRGAGGAPAGATLTNMRQHEAVANAVAALRQVVDDTAASLPHECLLLSLYTALQSLDLLTGETSQDDILEKIFSTFCIGK